MRLPISDRPLTYTLSRTVTKLSQIIVQSLDEKQPLCVFDHLYGLRGNVRCLSQAHWKARAWWTSYSC